VADTRQILFPTDLSPESDRAFEHARFLAERLGATLTLYHAIELPRREYARWARMEERVWTELEQHARAELERRAQTLAVPHHIVMDTDVHGAPLLVDVALLELIRRTEPDLVVMATHGREGRVGSFLGSVTQEVVRNAGRPVLCVRHAEQGLVLPYRNLVLPTDLSDLSRRAVPLAAVLARTCEARVVAVHVTPSPSLATLAGLPAPLPPAPPSPERVREFLGGALDGLPVDVRVCGPGPAWSHIVKLAVHEKADLVVMSTRGHDSLGDRILGSTTERVLRHASCPVLVV
jgi:nucleotide-binding universal stress UspA family protein